MITSMPTIACRTSVQRANGRLVVCCEVDHFKPSGLAVPELFARLQPQLTAAIEDAAVRGPDVDGAPQLSRVAIDVGDPDPCMSLWVHDPVKGLANLDQCFSGLEAIVTRLAAADRPAEGGAS
jgi:hypothetical protein